MVDEQIRADFERWARRNGWRASDLRRDADGAYPNGYLEAYWGGYQTGRAAISNPRPATKEQP